MPSIRRKSKMKAVAQEYLIMVGSPSNMYNGYVFEDNDGLLSPAKPAPKTVAEIDQYIHGTKAEPHFTHDRFWANFIYSAVVLVESGRIRPDPGDILTLAVFWPGYELRDQLDFDASPYNSLNLSSPWVKNTFPYDRTIRTNEKGVGATSNPSINKERSHKGGPPAPSERLLNHDILMREVDDSGFNGGFSKYSLQQDHHVELIHNIPRRLAFGLPDGGYVETPVELKIPPLKKVQVKLLVVRDLGDLLSYITTGTWLGDYWTHPLDRLNESSASNPLSGSSWYAVTNPLTVQHPDWSTSPTVNRSRVKIKRLDYFGHSNKSAFFLQYGTTNLKAEKPLDEIDLDQESIVVVFGGNVFTPDAVTQLWGCSLGDDGGFAENLAPHTQRTVACADKVSFEDILVEENRLPEPANPAFPFIVFP